MKKIFIILSTVLMLTANSVMAYDNPTPYVNKRMSGGIGNVTVYIDSSQTPTATY